MRHQSFPPVDGWINKLSLLQGDYAIIGRRPLFVVEAHSLLVEGHFDETNAAGVAEVNPVFTWSTARTARASADPSRPCSRKHQARARHDRYHRNPPPGKGGTLRVTISDRFCDSSCLG